MLPHDNRQKIENIIAGNVIKGQPDYCTAIRNLLCTGFTASRMLKKDFESKQRVKEEQATFLKQYSKQHNLLIEHPKAATQIASGGEARVYFSEDKRSVLKAIIVAIMQLGWNFSTACCCLTLFFQTQLTNCLDYHYAKSG